MTEVELEAIRRIVREEIQAAGTVGDLITSAQAATLVNVSESTVKRWLREGILTRHGEGRTVRISKQQLREVMARQATSPLTNADIERMADAALGRAG